MSQQSRKVLGMYPDEKSTGRNLRVSPPQDVHDIIADKHIREKRKRNYVDLTTSDDEDDARGSNNKDNSATSFKDSGKSRGVAQ